MIAGGIAAKAGLSKVLLGALIAAKKLIVVGVLAALAFIKKLLGRKTESSAPAA